jgi:hypothetical protein
LYWHKDRYEVQWNRIEDLDMIPHNYPHLKLNCQRPIWEGDQEVVNRSGRDEPIWVAIHKYVEAVLGISLYSYPYLI